jgi:hypothetical protein
LDKNNAPPKIYEAPKPDPKVAAKPRVNRSVDQPQERTVNKVPFDQPKPQPQKAPQPPPQPKAEKAPPEPHGKAPADSKQERPKGKDQGKDKN